MTGPAMSDGDLLAVEGVVTSIEGVESKEVHYDGDVSVIAPLLLFAAFFAGVLLTWLTICRPWACPKSTRGHRWETVRPLSRERGGFEFAAYRECRICAARRISPFWARDYEMTDNDWLDGLRPGLPR